MCSVTEAILTNCRGKGNTAAIGFTVDGCVFGWYLKVPVKEQLKSAYDPKMCIFSFESRGSVRR